MRAIILDYGSGNLRSAAKAFERARHEAGLTGDIVVTADPAALATASHIVLPGVGAYADCLQGIKAVAGLYDALHEQVIVKQKWFLGICVGMQLMLEHGFEHGEHHGFGWIEGQVVKLNPTKTHSDEEPRSSGCNLKIPHMGWNNLEIKAPGTSLLSNIHTGDHAYFVHSYHAQCRHARDVLATVDYGGNVAAVIGRGNMFGTQFHPEKSQHTGLELIRNFLAL